MRGEGGILTNKDGKRFMFDFIPDNYKAQTADNEEEGWRYCQGDKNARRPPELLTRDHVARCIVREIKEGRGSPHGGVFLDIAWIKEKIPNAAEHIKRKLPSMYHQFKQLGDMDITREPMEVGPTTHYVMGGIQVDADTQMSTRARTVCRGRMRRRHQRRQPARRQFAFRPDRVWETRRRIRRQIREGKQRRADRPAANRRGGPRARWSRSSATRRAGCEGPYQVQHDLQEMMQDLVGIVRREDEMLPRARRPCSACGSAPRRVGVTGHREYNPGWHTALDLTNLLTVSEAITRAALERKESRGAHFRDDFPDKDPAFGKVNIVSAKHPMARCRCGASRFRKCRRS